MFPERNTLYIVSTPIGNLEEISFRALEILRKCDFIACEDTRHSGILLKHFGINTRMISYYSNVEARKTDIIIDLLKEGKTGALISDAGTPCISDPGGMLVSRCLSEEIEVRAIPGSSSLIHALIMSGFPVNEFFFQGFLPQKKGRKTLIEELTAKKLLIVIFESPYRIKKTITELGNAFGNKPASVSRELTKKFEQTVRGGLKDLAQSRFPEKGEFVLIINNN
ncbi:MAG: 16S rRNA (cytidine(1402)-2'-O)-methyltransferase [Ignavibacteria bacterium]|nr:16S rRNA (cytidine(1402)-2'-O)-methyltransferase [Ignavibacteria bacterium]